MTAPRPDVRPSKTTRQNSTVHRPDPVGRPVYTDPSPRPSTPGVFDGDGEPTVRPRPRPRPSRPHRHLAAFAIALPASGTAGAVAGALDVFSTVAAAVLPLAVFVGVMTARLLLFRVFRWVWSVVTAVTGRLR